MTNSRMDRDALIGQIQDHDILIQSYVEDDSSKSDEELRDLSIQELREWLEMRQAVLKFLVNTEDDISDELPS